MLAELKDEAIIHVALNMEAGLDQEKRTLTCDYIFEIGSTQSSDTRLQINSQAAFSTQISENQTMSFLNFLIVIEVKGTLNHCHTAATLQIT